MTGSTTSRNLAGWAVAMRMASVGVSAFGEFPCEAEPAHRGVGVEDAPGGVVDLPDAPPRLVIGRTERR